MDINSYFMRNPTVRSGWSSICLMSVTTGNKSAIAAGGVV